MLANCLASLSQLTSIEGVETKIIVIDNEPEGSEKAKEAAGRFGTHYRHQPERGAIPQARNAALDAPRGVGATHLAFIDDDETADPDWLAALWACASEYGADAVHGLALSVYPEGAPAWRRCNEHKTRKTQTGDALAFVGTNNALLRLDLVGDLRFDERFRFVGGEDIVFFDALQKHGAKIAFCREAVTHEAVPWERINQRHVEEGLLLWLRPGS